MIRAAIVELTDASPALIAFWADQAQHRDGDPGFVRLIADSNPDCRGIRLLSIERDKRLVALAVGRLERTRVPARLGRFNLPVPQLEVLVLMHGGLLGDWDDAAADAAHTLLEGVLAARKADAVELHAASVSHPLARCFIDRPGQLRRDTGWLPGPLYHADLTLLNGSFLASMEPASRRKMGQRERKLIKVFGAGFRTEEITREEDVPRLMEAAETVMRQSYQRGLGVGFAPTEVVRTRLLHSARQGWLRAWVTWYGPDPACFWIGDVRRGTFQSDYMGYDMRFSEYSPGRILTVSVVEGLAATGSGVTAINFGMGEADWKERLASGVEQVATIHLFAPRTGAMVVNLARRSAATATAAARAALTRLGVFEALRRRLRGSGRRAAAQAPRPPAH